MRGSKSIDWQAVIVRHLKEYTTQELAIELGVHPRTIYRLKAGETKMPSGALRKILRDRGMIK